MARCPNFPRPRSARPFPLRMVDPAGPTPGAPGTVFSELVPTGGVFQRAESITSGPDPSLQGIGGNAFGTLQSVGLRVPALPTTTSRGRYLFLLASVQVPDGGFIRIRGYRQLVTIGFNAGVTGEAPVPRIVEMPVTTPTWRFQDGNISWHLYDMGPPGYQGRGNVPKPSASHGTASQTNGLAFRNSTSPSLLFEDVSYPAGKLPNGQFYTSITAYTPPNGGRPWGVPLVSGLSSFYALETPFESAHAWDSLDIGVEGPRTIGFFASLRQTDPKTRPPLLDPSGSAWTPATLFSDGLPPEEQFLLNYPGAIYWRVGGSLIVDS